MASESPAQKIAALQQEVARLRALQEQQAKQADKAESELKAAVADLERDVRQLREQIAAVTERAAALQRQSDRGWGLWQALLVLAISIAASAVTQLAIRK